LEPWGFEFVSNFGFRDSDLAASTGLDCAAACDVPGNSALAASLFFCELDKKR
jgi:hypothetical protein